MRTARTLEAVLTKQYFDEQFDAVLRAVRDGFDRLDERFDTFETNNADLTNRA